MRKTLLMALLCFSLCLVLPTVMGDNNNNDSFATAETAAAATYTGNVSQTSDQYDYYMVSIPGNKDINVTITLTSQGSIEVTAYYSTMGLIYSFHPVVTVKGHSNSDSYWNSGDSAKEIYLCVGGSGNYTLAIKFTNDSADALENVTTVCGGMLLCMVLGIVGGIALIIIIIALIVWRIKKSRSPPMNNPTPTAYQDPPQGAQAGQPQPQLYPQGQQQPQPQYQQQPQPQLYQQGQTQAQPQYQQQPQPQMFDQGAQQQTTMGQPPK